jgi:G2/mitotic-specific cyclin 3/4
MRLLRVKNDENMPPEGQIPKTIHQRNKSSPALVSSFADSQGLKAAAKRTAFGDVSNVVAGRPSRDDSSLQTKSGVQGTIKPSQSLDSRKSIALLRPAQKGLKTILGAATTAPLKQLPSIPTSEHENVLHPLPAKKILSKRATTIFRDNRLEVVQETEIPLPTELATTYSVLPSSLLSAPQQANSEPCLLPPPASIPAPAEPTKLTQSLHSDSSLPGIEEVSLGPSFSSDVNVETQVNDSSVTAIEHVAQHASHIAHNEGPPVLTAQDNVAAVHKDLPPMAVSTFPNPVENIPPLSPHHTYIQRRIDQEECWDEEDEDNYEEEGYVTARSFRSKGDNTTGGATAVLFPQLNQRVRKEIAAAKQMVEATRSPEDLEDETYDTSMVAEYGDEIFEYMQQLEVKMLPNAHYMDNQHEIQWSMRSVLMDWLVQVHLRFNLLPETLFLTVNYIDRFLSCKVVSLGKLQLVGATAIFIAAKYEEINCPSVQEIVYMVDGGYSMDEVLKAERFMLTMLQFELGWPGPMSFLRRISKADDYDLETRTLAKYFLEVTLMDERFIGSPPSFTAAASHCLARIMLRKGTWVSSTPKVEVSKLTIADSSSRLLFRLHFLSAQANHYTAA